MKIDSPRHAYFGGEIAAPVTKVVLRAALASRNAALDRSQLATVERVKVPGSVDTLAQAGEVAEAPRRRWRRPPWQRKSCEKCAGR